MKKLINLIKHHWILLSSIILIAITFLSLSPLEQLPPAPPGSDKTHHLIAYALLMLPTALRKPNHWILIGLLFIGYSGLIELIQPYVNRYGEWLDLLANTTGIVCGIIAARVLEFMISRKPDVN